MRRVVSAMLSACVLVSLSILTGPVKAGDYYDDGSYRQRNSNNTWYSSDCCYQKIVRHERSVHYQRLDDERSYDRQSYYDRPYSRSYTYDKPRQYEDYSYAPRRHVSYNYSGYSSYAGYSSYDDICRRHRLADGLGGWVWAVRAGCR
jgi:hypothetical protein